MNEKIFNSSQDMWRTLNDRKFLDNVQEFYNARAVLEQQWKEWICFRCHRTNASYVTTCACGVNKRRCAR